MTLKDKRPRTCPECGSDTIWSREFSRVSAEKSSLYDSYKRALAQWGLDRAQWELDKINLTEGRKWLQRKVDVQRKQLNRLENKLIELGKQPYKVEDN